MKLYIKQQIISIKEIFHIYNENDEVEFTAQGKVISIGRKINITDKQNNNVIYIEQQIFHLLPTYKIFIRGQQVCTVRKKFSPFQPKFIIQPQNLNICGDFWNYHYNITNNNNQELAKINKQPVTFGNQYVIDIYDENIGLLLLALIIVVACDVNDVRRRS